MITSTLRSSDQISPRVEPSRFDRQYGVQGYGSSKALDRTKPGFLQQRSIFGQRSLSAFRADNHV
jgi:hypothetical protein